MFAPLRVVGLDSDISRHPYLSIEFNSRHVIGLDFEADIGAAARFEN
jgi:hypothetical protein